MGHLSCLKNECELFLVVKVAFLTTQERLVKFWYYSSFQTVMLMTITLYLKGMAGVCKDAAQACLDALCSIRQTGSCQVAELRSRVCELAELARSLDSELQGGTTEQIAESLEAELQSMDKAIEEAAKKIEVSGRISIINLFPVLFCLECKPKVPEPNATYCIGLFCYPGLQNGKDGWTKIY